MPYLFAWAVINYAMDSKYGAHTQNTAHNPNVAPTKMIYFQQILFIKNKTHKRYDATYDAK